MADLRHGATLGLFKSVTRDLLEVGLFEVTVCEIHKVFRWSPLRFVLEASCFLLVTILFVPLSLKMLLFILVIEILLYLERNESILLGDKREVWSRHDPGDRLPADILGICLPLAGLKADLVVDPVQHEHTLGEGQTYTMSVKDKVFQDCLVGGGNLDI